MIAERIHAAATKRWEPYKPTAFWASRIGHPCARYLYHVWVDWDKATPHPDSLLEVFAEGRAQERAVELMLAECKFRLIEGQSRIQLDDPPISGKVEGRILPEVPLPGWPEGPRGSRAILYEIKSVSPYSYPHLNSVADMLNSDRWYERMWPTQLQVYLHALKEDLGVMLIKAKTRMAVKELWVEADADYVGGILARTREIHAAILALNPPERTEGEQCKDCEHQLTCRPDIFYGQTAHVDSSAELTILLDIRAELMPASVKLNEVNDKIKKLLGDRETVVAGDWLVRGTWVERKETVQAASRFLRRTYTRMGGDG